MNAEKRKLKDYSFTIIPNDLLEAFFTVKMSSTQYKICLYLLRKTYGWHQDSAAVSLSQFVDACGGTPQWLSVQIQELARRRIIHCENKIGRKSVYRINDHTEEWIREDQKAMQKCAGKHSDGKQSPEISKVLPLRDHMKEVSCANMIELSRSSMIPLSCSSMIVDSQSALEQSGMPDTLKKDLKKYIKKEKKAVTSFNYAEDSLYYELAQLLLDNILAHLPEFLQPDLQHWAKTMQLIIEKDKRNPETVRQVIIYSQKDPFWRTNILDAVSLRHKFDHLNAKRLSQSNNKQSKGIYDDYEIFFL